MSVLQDRKAQVQSRYDQVKKDGEKIHALVKEVQIYMYIHVHCGNLHT